MQGSVHDSEGGRWYVKRGQEVRGPFRWELIEKYVALGRIRDSDSVSSDGVSWQRMRALRAAPAPADPAAVGGLAAVDERRVERRAADTTGRGPGMDPGRAGADRRAAESPAVVARRARSEKIWAGLRAHSERPRGPMLATAAVLVSVMLAAVLLSLPRERAAPDCAAAAAPGVNWDFCNKHAIDLSDRRLGALSARNAKLTSANLAGATLTRADLAYADLSAADLSLANLEAARLVGANLRLARLGHARLAGADLRFVDFTGAHLAGTDLSGARLASAIWIDGRICTRQSVGMCAFR